MEPPDLLTARRAHTTRLSAGGTPTPNFHSRAVPFKRINWIGPSNKLMAAYSSPLQPIAALRWAIATQEGMSRNEQQRHIGCMDTSDPSDTQAGQSPMTGNSAR